MVILVNYIDNYDTTTTTTTISNRSVGFDLSEIQSCIQCIGKNFNLCHFYMIKNYVNLRTFFNPENWLADKNKLFSCLCIGLAIIARNLGFVKLNSKFYDGIRIAIRNIDNREKEKVKYYENSSH